MALVFNKSLFWIGLTPILVVSRTLIAGGYPMNINLSFYSEVIVDQIVTYNAKRVPDLLTRKNSASEMKNYFHTIDVINSQKGPRLATDRSITVKEYRIPSAFACFILPNMVTVVASDEYTDVLVRPDITKKETEKLEVLEPERFNLISGLLATCLEGETGEINRVDMLLSTVMDSHFVVVEGYGSLNYDKREMPIVLQERIGFLKLEEMYTTGFEYGALIERVLNTKISK